MCPSPAAVTSPTTAVETQAFNILVATAGEDESAGAVRTAALLSRYMAGSLEVLTVHAAVGGPADSIVDAARKSLDSESVAPTATTSRAFDSTDDPSRRTVAQRHA